MSSILVKFANKLRPCQSTEVLQVDSSADRLFLTSLLNTILHTNSQYFLFYKNERILENLISIIEKCNLCTEDVLDIDYIDEKDIGADSSMHCSDVVRSFALFQDKLFYLTYEGKIFEVDQDQLVTKNEIYMKNNSRTVGIFVGRELYGYASDSIFKVDGGGFLEVPDEIRCCSAYKKHIAVGCANSIYLVNADLNTIEKIAGKPALGASVRSIQMNSDIVAWIQGHGSICIYERSTKSIKVHKTPGGLTALKIHDGNLVALSSCHLIIKISLESGKIDEYINTFRYSNALELKGNAVIHASQKYVAVERINNGVCNGTSDIILAVHGQINSIILIGSSLYVAHDNAISRVSLERKTTNSDATS
ncbi:uncharacterized protein VICG_00633 [Vittaforma corneae ATCC 50505]|uniref:Uncharacterized protein n=1 Tax=Vittaforma corneae (strain ATCC 50505) TaxID=993615 RepID=L2GNP0_VITCO|nr:uncharacterized protein VICG_00633 [Vittaforma corneae ATCC 50505]ELA42234.1 hypothetical protein VICG_00633 [Vittaforma corneae ATCC 50505]